MEDIRIIMTRGRKGKKKAAAKRRKKLIKEPKEITYSTPTENICTACMNNLQVNSCTFLNDDDIGELKCIYCERVTKSKFVPLDRKYIRNSTR